MTAEGSPRPPIRPRYRIVRGLRMPLGFPSEALESGLTYRPEPGDIFVASYPKSGTTWLQYIVYLLVRGRALEAGDSLNDVFPHLEEVGRAAVEALERPRLIKTHLSLELTPAAREARYLVIARNPFDVCVSFYHHTRGFPRHYDFADGRFEDFFECFLHGEVDFGDYFTHLKSWYGAAEAEPNVLFLTYESLKADARSNVRRIADFLGAAADDAESDAALDAVVAEASFSGMRRNQERWSSARPQGMPAFVRKGVVGDWRSLLTPPQTALLLAKFNRELADSAASGLWPEILAGIREGDRPRGARHVQEKGSDPFS